MMSTFGKSYVFILNNLVENIFFSKFTLFKVKYPPLYG